MIKPLFKFQTFNYNIPLNKIIVIILNIHCFIHIKLIFVNTLFICRNFHLYETQDIILKFYLLLHINMYRPKLHIICLRKITSTKISICISIHKTDKSYYTCDGIEKNKVLFYSII